MNRIKIEYYDTRGGWRKWADAYSEEALRRSVQLFADAFRDYGDGRYRVIREYRAVGGVE